MVGERIPWERRVCRVRIRLTLAEVRPVSSPSRQGMCPRKEPEGSPPAGKLSPLPPGGMEGLEGMECGDGS